MNEQIIFAEDIRREGSNDIRAVNEFKTASFLRSFEAKGSCGCGDTMSTDYQLDPILNPKETRRSEERGREFEAE